jgi:signal transduction histidine kinase
VRLPIQQRLALLLGVVVVVLAGALAWLQHAQRRELRLMFTERIQQTGAVLDRVVGLQQRPFAVHADDYSRWDEFVDYVREHDEDWARVNLEESIGTFSLDMAWVLDRDGRVAYVTPAQRGTGLAAPPADPVALNARLARAHFLHFFAGPPAAPLEVWTAPIQPSSDFARATPPVGYYVVARRWTPAVLEEHARVVGGRLALQPAPGHGAPPRSVSASGRIEIARPLPGLDGRPAAELRLVADYPIVKELETSARRSLVTLGLIALLLVVLVYVALSRWVARPMRALTDALRRGEPGPLGGLTRARDEFGGLAALMVESFAQRETIEREVRERRATEQELQRARGAAEAGAQAKARLLANASHELRTPLHGILSFARFGQAECERRALPSLKDDFQNIHECGSSLLALLDDLLDLARLESGRMRFERVPMALEDVLDGAAGEFEPLMDERGLRLDLQVEGPLPPVRADRLKLLQVVRNLLSNASRYTPPGGVIEVRATHDAQWVRVTVRDHGPGIPADELEQVFQAFVQASSNHTGGGTGLGLAICREILTAHDGAIWAENPPDGGARLVFEVPRADVLVAERADDAPGARAA